MSKHSMDSYNKYFRSVRLSPSHSARSCVITWTVRPEIADSEFYIYKKYDGGAEWELLNTTAVTGNTYTDTDFVIKTKMETPVYKILAIDSDGLEYESHETAMYSRVTRKDYGIASSIIRTHYKQARQDGLVVLYYPLIREGEIASNVDPITGQIVATNNDGEVGTYYDGGYHPPFLTYIRMMKSKLVQESVTDIGTIDQTQQHTVFLAHPPVRTDDLIVDVATDRRWLVGEGVNTDMLRGAYPVSYTGLIVLQDTTHACYDVAIPENYDEMYQTLIKVRP